MENKKPVIFLAFANDKVDDALYLRNLPKELHGIREALHKAVQAGLCEVVERTAATIDNIFDIFQDPYYKDRIAIFHYGGHASGTQLMLETLDGGHGASHSEGLVPFFGKQNALKLVFFNGCASQEQSLEMIEEGVPAVIGTSTAIKDEIATELATRFYNGIATGQSLEQAWQQSIDAVKTKTGTRKNKGLRLRRDKSADFPWRMYVRQGSEIVKSWNLPLAVNNPLFGLPKLPQKHNLPEEPFRFLERYKEEHAEIFFGRGKYIRDLYNRASDANASPVILLYGQSGVGKSSMLDSGVLPRLEQKNTVKYIRRNHTIGVLGTLRQALGLEAIPNQTEVEAAEVALKVEEARFQEKIAPLTSLVPQLDEELKSEVSTFLDRLRLKHEVNQAYEGENSGDVSIIAKKWKALEEASGEPFIILLDQVEEIFTKSHPEQPNELDDLMQAVQQVFKNPQTRPQGKLILSYRKEYHPEIEEGCKNYQIPREEIFLKQLSKSDIKEVILGLTSTTRLQKRYRMTVEEGLPDMIADDLLEDKDSPIAPVLQILLTKMWNMVEHNEMRRFTTTNYVELKKEGILMDDFFEQQMEKLRAWSPEIETSGLALDVLNYHTTRLATAGSHDLDEIRARYQHRQDVIDHLILKFKDLYLLTDAGFNRTGLAHDTIAPLVKETVRQSDAPGQRAFRILSNKIPNFEKNPNTLLDEEDLSLVEQGKKGMRLWTASEQELVKKSQDQRARRKRRWAFLRAIGVVAVLAIIGLAFAAFHQSQQKEEQRLIAEAKKIEADAKAKAEAEARRKEQKAKDEAIVARALAEEEKRKADIAKNEAITARALAEEERKRAEKERDDKEEARRLAVIAKNKETAAKLQEKKAKEAAEAAQILEEKAKEAAIKAKEETQAQKDKIAAVAEAAQALTYIQEDQNIKAAETALNAYDMNKRANGPKYKATIYQAMNESLEALQGKDKSKRNVFAEKQTLSKDLEVNHATGELAFSFYKNRNNGQINIIKNFDKKEQQVLKINREIRALRFSPKGEVLLAGTFDGKILGWKRSSSGKYVAYKVFDKEENDFGGSILSISFAQQGANNFYYLAFNTADRFYVYQIGDEGDVFKKKWVKDIKSEYVMLSPKGTYLATATAGGLQLFTTNFGKTGQEKLDDAPMKRLFLRESIRAIFNEKEDRLAVGNANGAVLIYDLKNEKELYRNTVHKSPISALKFSKNGEQLVSSSHDGNGKLWNLSALGAEGEELLILEGANSWIYDIDYDNSNEYIYALSQDKTIRKWYADIEKLYEELKKVTKEKKAAMATN